ncbi:MAG: thioredoxin family protein [Comamonadaceae bacterium]|nr:thioredoxin family protein [Comamonadaceae bacterium]
MTDAMTPPGGITTAALSRRCGAWLAALALWLLLAATAYAQTPWIESDAEGNARVHLYFFWSETCPHCLQARPFVEAIPRERPWVILHSLEVSRNRENAQRFIGLAESLGQAAEGVPTLIVCGEMEVGWEDALTSGAALLERLDTCRAQGRSSATPATAAKAKVAGLVRVPLLGELDSASLSLPVFTLVLAGLDAFNPCAFFVLLFLLSLLAHQKDRRRMLVIGACFVLTSGLMYFAFMAAWLNVFQFLGRADLDHAGRRHRRRRRRADQRQGLLRLRTRHHPVDSGVTQARHLPPGAGDPGCRELCRDARGHRRARGGGQLLRTAVHRGLSHGLYAHPDDERAIRRGALRVPGAVQPDLRRAAGGDHGRLRRHPRHPQAHRAGGTAAQADVRRDDAGVGHPAGGRARATQQAVGLRTPAGGRAGRYRRRGAVDPRQSEAGVSRARVPAAVAAATRPGIVP